MNSTLMGYLLKYSKYQEDITLVYRPTLKSSWANRCTFLDEEFDDHVPYNHRSILKQEVVCEYDTDDPQINKYCVYEVAKRLRKDGIGCAIWDSGNKSRHLHFFIDTKKAGRVNLLKSVLLRHYGVFVIDGKRIVPDLRLASNNSLIRAEFGVHEKTGRLKTRVRESRDYLVLNKLPIDIWDKYSDEVAKVIKARLSTDSRELSKSKYIKYLLSTDFRDAEDGRERALFILIHTMKCLYLNGKGEFIKFLQEWYKYSGGTKLTAWSIQCKVNYHWEKRYTITERYIKEFFYTLDIDVDLKT